MLRIVHIKTTTKRGVFQPHFLRIRRKRLGSTSAGVGNSFRSRLFFVLSRLITVVCGRLHHIINIMWYRGGDAVTLTEYAAAEQRPELLTQWDAARNGALTPDDVSPGSEKRVWWRCGKGHQWQSTIGSRARLGTGCPYCTGKRPIPGETDLLTKHPALAAQWHPTKNGALTPRDVTAGSMRRVWWRCDIAPASGCCRASTTSPPCVRISRQSGTPRSTAP